jgi:hypothetical protein
LGGSFQDRTGVAYGEVVKKSNISVPKSTSKMYLCIKASLVEEKQHYGRTEWAREPDRVLELGSKKFLLRTVYCDILGWESFWSPSIAAHNNLPVWQLLRNLLSAPEISRN